MGPLVEVSEIVMPRLDQMDRLLLAAMFVQILLMLGLLIRMGVLRVAAVRGRQVRMSEIALASDKYPEAAKKAGNALNNQFQLPVVFYVIVVLILVLGHTTQLQMVLAWLFVLSRYAHAFVHIGNNDLNLRFGLYLVGVFVLTAFIVSAFLPVLFLAGQS